MKLTFLYWLRFGARARDNLTKLDEQEPEEIEAHREAEADKLPHLPSSFADD